MAAETLIQDMSDGDVVFREGDPADGLYVLRSGKVVISRHKDGHETVLARLSDGDIFGEMALFDSKPRSATARVSGEAKIEYISRDDLMARIDDPLVWSLIQDMASRLRATDDAFQRLETQQASREDVMASFATRRRWMV